MRLQNKMGWAAAATLLCAGMLCTFTPEAAAQDHEEAVPAAPVAQGAGVFPGRPKAAADVLARGKAAYTTNCAYCHGDDARGGENGGTNLLRSDYVMKDRNGEVIAPFLLNSSSTEHKFSFTSAQAADIAAFIHDFRLNSRDPGRMRPPTVVVGNATAGQAYFQAKCGACHSVNGDLKGLAARIPDPRNLQQTWLMPVLANPRRGGENDGTSSGTNVPPVTITVTLENGQKVEGRLGRIDDFLVTLTQDDGTRRSFRRDDDKPKVEVHDPLRPHKDLLRVYTDKDIHDVTAYLVNAK